MSARRTIGLAVTVLALAGIAGAAWAYLHSSGSGSGSGAPSVTVQQITISNGTATSKLIPTGTATGDVKASVSNPNSGSVHIPQISLDTSGTHATGFSANAASCALSFTTQTNGGAGYTFAAGSTSIDLTSSLTMGTGAASSCQGQTFTVFLKGS